MRWQKLAKQRKFLVFSCFAYFRRIFPSISLGSIIFTSRRADSIRYVCARARVAAAVCGVCGYIEFRVPNTSYLCVIRRSFNICSFLTVVVCTCSIQFSCYISFHFKCIYFPRSVFININLVIVK